MNNISQKYLSIILFTLALLPIYAAKHSVTFRYSPNVVPKSVSIAGSFNNWSSTANIMNDDDNDGVWTIKIELEDGEYQYKFVVNGDNWYQDINNKLSAPDGYGGRNSIIRVGDYELFKQNAKRGDSNILTDAVYHEPEYPYFTIINDSTVWLELRIKANDIDSALCIVNHGRKLLMHWYATDGTFDYYLKRLSGIGNYLKYSFIVFDGNINFEYPKLFSIELDTLKSFSTPDWISNAIFYQIFPERFANGDIENDPQKTIEWGGKPEYNNFFGGDLVGIIEHLDYIKEIGVNAIYLNPIFLSPSNHKYDMSDPMKIDPHFGNIKIFKTLIDSCHSMGIKLIIDGVFHDTGREHWAFQDIVKNGKKSKYVNWYDIYSFPVGPIDKPNYKCWWGFGSLPSLMTKNPDVRAYLFREVRYWTEMGIDGWRLDCPNEVEDEFWRMFHDTVKSINPQCYILGEIWGDGSNWLEGDMFDAVMNYRFRDACLDFFAYDRITSEQFAQKYFSMIASYSPNVNYSSFNLLGSHDTPRFITLCNGNKDKLRLAWFFQMTAIGAPSIYYGDEIGIEGGKDPDCRKCFIWDTLAQNRKLLRYMKKIIKLRKSIPAIAMGNVVKYNTPDDNSIVMLKKYNDSAVIIMLNKGDTIINYPINEIGMERKFEDLITSEMFSPNKNRIATVPIYSHSGRIVVEIN